MINQTYIDDKKVKDILTYISGMRHAEQIRMMFLCSLNGMRSINFCYLQVKDVYNPDLSVKDVICLDENNAECKTTVALVVWTKVSMNLHEQYEMLFINCEC